jgi:hypothetical protein
VFTTMKATIKVLFLSVEFLPDLAARTALAGHLQPVFCRPRHRRRIRG